MKKTLFDDTGRGLAEYRRKRDFQRTAEPPARREKKRAAKELMFVIQKHDATRLHYDFRLEMEGVLKSWAVPKGLPYIRGDKRLAVHVEDHPMDYARFEGTIPEGNYGAGTVMVWDMGTYTVLADDPLKALRDGKFHLQLHGQKLKGEWAFVRMKPRPGDARESWLIFKAGADMKPLSGRKEDASLLTGRSMNAIASQNKAQWQSSPTVAKSRQDPRIAAAVRARKAAPAKRQVAAVPTAKPAQLKNLPAGKIAFVDPMKCRLVEKPPEGSQWIYEIKFDGFRALALKDGTTVQLLSRSNKDMTARFRSIAEAVGKLPVKRGIIDGEIVALDEQGRSSFQLLQMAHMPGQPKPALAFYAFDLLNLEGKDTRKLPLTSRKQQLQNLVTAEHEPIRFSADIHGDPQKLLVEIKSRGMEGIIAKQVHSEYESGQRTGCWKKIKVVNEQEFVIGGYTPPKGSRDRFGAILVGYFEGEKLIFVSKVGTGFNQALLALLYKKFQALRTAKSPFANLPERRSFHGTGLTAAEMRKCTWITPKLAAEIRFTEWTRDNHLRHPVFLGLRDDINPQEVRKEKPS